MSTERQLLTQWAETVGCYQYLHQRSFQQYQIIRYVLGAPIIILSTVAGVLNFASTTLDPVRLGVALGSLNLVVAVLSSMEKFFTVTELAEGHRSATISYDKLYRRITVELSMPEPNPRLMEMIQTSRLEMDKLMEQSPFIPANIIRDIANDERFKTIQLPNIVRVQDL
jgi:hypothetical protein